MSQSKSNQVLRGYTLVELLVTIAIVAALMTIILPSISGVIKSGRQMRCQAGMRSVTFDFLIFADDQLHGNRGEDDAISSRYFRLETFQESEYGLDEFWRWPNEVVHSQTASDKEDLMRCPEERGDVALRKNLPCGASGAVSPPENVSYGFNLRLHRAERRDSNGVLRLMQTRLTELIKDEQASTPLFWDVDGAVAESKGVVPVFSAPSIRSLGPIGTDRFWFPSTRHQGATNVAFMGGHVLSSTDPAGERGWRWEYQPPR